MYCIFDIISMLIIIFKIWEEHKVARLKKASKNFLKLFKRAEVLPAEFKNHHEIEKFEKVQVEDFYMNF